jgi:hypothetical protein
MRFAMKKTAEAMASKENIANTDVRVSMVTPTRVS